MSDRPDTPDDSDTRDPLETPPPRKMREDPDWFKAIGPEDEDEEVIEEGLEEYGWNQMDEDDFESDPVGPADMPDWTEGAVYGEDRPLMPDYDDELDDIEDVEDDDAYLR